MKNAVALLSKKLIESTISEAMFRTDKGFFGNMIERRRSNSSCRPLVPASGGKGDPADWRAPRVLAMPHASGRSCPDEFDNADHLFTNLLTIHALYFRSVRARPGLRIRLFIVTTVSYLAMEYWI